MNILQALFFPPEQPGGVSSMVPHIQERFSNAGWEMVLFSLPKRIRNKGSEDAGFETFDWRAFAGHPIIDKYMQTFKDYIWWVKLRINRRFDIIHAHHPIAALALKRVFPDTPIAITIHSSYEQELRLNGRIGEGSPEQKFLSLIYGELEKKMDRIITVSESFKAYLAQHVQHPERIAVIPNGFDEKRFTPVDHDNAVVQLISVCRLVPAKGLEHLLKACSELKKRGREFVLHLIGDGPIRKELEQMAVNLNIYEETIFYGYVLHPEQFMPFFDIFVLPSQAEAFGSVFAEAALCRMALVGTDVGGIAEQIEDGVNGLLVPVGDSAALAEALDKLMLDPALRAEIAQKARDKALKTYSLTRVIDQLTGIYQGMSGK